MSSKTASTKGTNVLDYDLIVTQTTSYAAISLKEAEEIAKIDAPNVSTNVVAYVKNNLLSYYLIINLWIFQVDEHSRLGRFMLIEAMKTLGLIETIAICSRAADTLVDFIGSTSVDITNVGCDLQFVKSVIEEAPNDRVALQLLRFPKRFSPQSADQVAQASIDAFINVNRKCKIGNRSERSYYWVDRVRARISEILRGFCVDYNKGFFSQGMAADADRPLADKLNAYSMWDPCLYHTPLYAIGHDKTHRNVDDYAAIVQAVPKSYKSARIIAEEHAYRQFHMQAIRMEMERCIRVNGYEGYLNLHSQEANQRLAWEGSYNPTYATIDLTAASDSVERGFAYSVLPQSVVQELDRFLPKYFLVGHRRARMDMFCTSGSAVTFPVESIIFLAICLEVTETCHALTGEAYVPPCVFGDDMLVDVAVFDTVMQVLGQLRFTANPSKSFGENSRYRESCGVEYLDGYALSTKYWPRSTVSFKPADVAAAIGQLCSLQHSFYDNVVARIFLATVVRCLEPRMTSHYPGTACADLWEPIPKFNIVPAPFDRDKMDSSDYTREVHLTMKTRRRNRADELTSAGYTKRMLVEMWLYATFLKSGPNFDDELSRLLGVTTKPASIASLCDTGEVYWDFARE